MRWYMDETSKVGKYSSLDEMAQEYLLLQRIMEYLIHNQQTVIVIQDAPEDDEGNKDDTQRMIALNPNYVLE